MRIKPFAFTAATLTCFAGASSSLAGGFQQTNLITDDQAVNHAQITDPNLINPWGTSFSPTSPFWISDNGTGKSTLYNVNPVTNLTTQVGLVVSITGDGSVTGQAFNAGSGFNSDRFLFVNEDGTISGWRGGLGTTAEVLKLSDANNVYKGATLDNLSGFAYLLSANFHTGAIDVLKGSGAAPNLSGNFVDPGTPSGFAPFNVQILGGTVYVTYAKMDVGTKDEVDGAGLGFVSAFDQNGVFLRRIASGGTLNAPWGLAIAPTSFGSFAGDLLVGNFGDGRINAFNLATNTFVSQLTDSQGKALSIDGLWALTAGNGGGAGSPDRIFFTSGPGGESHGLVGSIAAAPEPATILGLGIGLVALLRKRRK